MSMKESGEMYLETILILQEKNGTVRSVDIANELQYTKASISRAMSILKKSKHIEIGEHSTILLTEKGLQKARDVMKRHRVIAEFLVKSLGVDNELADKDACKIEHIISDEVFNKMIAFIEKT